MTAPADLKYYGFREKEAAALGDATKQCCIPTPSGSEWDAVVKKYNLPTPVAQDRVLSKVTLPPGWKYTPDPSDQWGRRMSIVTDTGVEVASVFLKNTGYDYYGSTRFDADVLKKLGIME